MRSLSTATVACTVHILATTSGCGRIGFDGAIDAMDASKNDGPNIDGPAALACKAGLPATCGPSGAGSCCESPLVTGAMYSRSYDMAVDGMFPDPSFTATLSDYRLDKYEITVGRFRQFFDEGLGTQVTPPVVGTGAHPNIANSGWNAAWNASLPATTVALKAQIQCNAVTQMWTDAPAGNENRPMNCLTWYLAMAFCAWDGGYLPTEAQWDFAAAGGTDQRAYPWSNPPSSLQLDPVDGSYSDGTDCVGDGLPGCAATDLIAVGTKPAGDGRWEQSDLAGNVWEWTLDSYATPYAIASCSNCADLTVTGGRAVRGGYFSAPIVYIRSASRFGNGENFLSSTQGARCAREP